jgi:Tfp pilus assembly protein PilZ
VQWLERTGGEDGAWGVKVALEKEDQGHHLRVRLELVEEFCSRKPWHLHTFTNYI